MGAEDFLDRDGLYEYAVEPRRVGTHASLDVVIRRASNEPNPTTEPLSQPPRKLNAVELRERNLGHHSVRLNPLGRSDRCSAVVCNMNFIAKTAQEDGEGVGHRTIVINHEHGRHFGEDRTEPAARVEKTEPGSASSILKLFNWCLNTIVS